MKKFLSIAATLLLATGAWAVPAKSTVFCHTQADGTVLTLRLAGDEYQHYYLNTQTGEKMQKGANGDFVALSESTFLAQQEAAAIRRTNSNRQRAQRLSQMQAQNVAQGPNRIGSFGNMTGRKKGIVILVNFADKAFNSSHTQATFERMFNQEGYNENGHIGSVADYFKAQSYNQFHLDFDVVGPVTLSNNMSYYGANNANGNDLHPGHMIKEACQAIDGQVNFADYDWDGDGYVDQVFVIYSGYGENYSGADENTIWPHEWDLNSSGARSLSVDGVTVNTYACCAELYGTSGTILNGIGTACHEFSHCLGYPDFYDTDYSGGVGMDSYDVMCSGSYNGPNGRGEVPSGYTAYERWMAGWLAPIELQSPATVTNMPDLNSEGTAYIIYNSANRNEYFLLENRQSSGWFGYYDSNVAGHGLFITHIDYNSTAWNSNEPNDISSHQRMTWVPADKNYGSYSSTAKQWTLSSAQQKGDYYPGTGNVSAFTPSSWSSVGGKWFTSESGSYYSPHTLTQIAETNGQIAFLFDGGDDGSRYTITYNAGGGRCTTASWTQSSSHEAATLPTADIESEEWQFAGWSTSSVALTTVRPTLLAAGASYTPAADCTLYAVYSKTDAEENSGSYTLSYSQETALSGSTAWGSYGTAYTYTATDGGIWRIKAYKSGGMQINKGKDASIKVPECPNPISSIDITKSTNKTVSFSTTDYLGNNTPTAEATSGGDTSVSLNLSGKGLTTGYIYTTDGASVITEIVVNYGASSTTYYATWPELRELPTPSIAFALAEDKAMLVGDTYTNIATATCEGVTLPAVSYSSSNPEIAIVDEAGAVTALQIGSAVITATVGAVSNQSREASTSYNVTVSMPVLTAINVTTAPDKTVYTEGDVFEPAGMIVTATYENGYAQEVSDWIYAPATALLPTDNTITVSYTEGGITKITTLSITINEKTRYNVSFSVNGTIVQSQTLIEGEDISIPSVENIEDKVFTGWVTTSAVDADEEPEYVTPSAATADITYYAVFATPSEENCEPLTESLTQDEIAGLSAANALAYATQTTFTDGDIDYSMYVYTDQSSRNWIQLKKDAGVYILISAPAAINEVRLLLTSTNNTRGGVNDITMHESFAGAVALTAEDCTYSTTSPSVVSTDEIVDSEAILTPTGSYSSLYLKVSVGARIWGIDVSYGSAGNCYTDYTTLVGNNEDGPATGMELFPTENTAIKRIMNGHLVIIREGKSYDATGCLIK